MHQQSRVHHRDADLVLGPGRWLLHLLPGDLVLCRVSRRVGASYRSFQRLCRTGDVAVPVQALRPEDQEGHLALGARLGVQD